MAEIINLRRAKKAKARDSADQQAAANRAKFGQTKFERRRTKSDAEKTARDLDGAQLDRDKSSD
jgi:hypothetical protein